MKPRMILAWILVGLGVLFLVSGLIVTTFATVSSGGNMPQADAVPASMWVEFANRIMDFTLELLAMEWTATRVGIFFIVVGMVLEGVGVYTLISTTK
ncbi:MAG: hypothetical protein ISR58_10200 [Anaerolineales bacterium]|nr:hypothetical protein [Chloroflexota bacterium]MBL6981544.1 hypothetical protein [Anaerolineales bacterium]